MVKGKHSASSSDKANNPQKEENEKKNPWHQCQCSGSSQIPSQDDLNYHQFLSLYKIMWINGRAELIIYDTENEKEEIKILDTELKLNATTSITQLPNGELFCYGNSDSGIIDRNYRLRIYPSGTSCFYSPTLYFNNNIYCFGGIKSGISIALSRKFDLKNNRWINLPMLPEADNYCHSVIFNENILISGYYYKNIWLYTIEIDSFSIIPYDFKSMRKKFLINVESLYLIEWGHDGLIYESEDEYHWSPISKSEIYHFGEQMYCLYNKEKIYICYGPNYYQFDLKKKVVSQIKLES